MEEDELEKYVPFTEESLLRLKEKREQLKRRNDNDNMDKTSTAQQAVIKGVSLNLTADGSEDFIMDHPDPTLEDSQELRLVCGKFPDNLHSALLEDIDFYYTERGEETFCVVSRRFGTNTLYRFSASKSFYFLSPFHPLRKFAVRAKIHPLFDTLVMLTIIINCVFLALDDEVRSAEYVFLAMYILEMLVKMIARGVVMDKHSYLRDPWNWLDFVVVIIALTTISYDANLSGLRAFRVLRAFKSVSIIPGLRTIVNAIFNSMKPLGEVMLIMIFLLVIIALIALQAYQGVLRRRCVKYPPPALLPTSQSLNWTLYVTDPDNWFEVEGETAVCGNSTGSGICPDGFICLADVGPNPNYGHTNFDHMGYSLLTTFQLITLDYWENVYNMIIRAQGPWNVFFFLMSVVLGPFYLLNLLLAVVALAYSNEHQKQQKMEEKRARAKWHAKRKALRRRRLQEAAAKNKCDCDVTSGGSAEHSGGSVMGCEHLDACSKQAEYRERPKDLSVESSDSSTTDQSYVMAQLGCFVSWFMFHFCSWTCHPLFKRFQLNLQKITQNNRFDYFIMFCIIINTICFAIDHHGITEELENNLNLFNQIFTIIFTLEMLIKVLAYGPIRYITDLWNLFDFSIVVISLFEFLSFLLSTDQGLPPLNILRTLRLLRVLRLARIWGTMHKLVMIIRSSICAVSYLTVVLFLILYIFAVIGKQWYGTRYSQSGSMFEDGEIPRWNFTDFYHSFLLVWRVMCGEWIEPLYDCLYITRDDNDKFCIPLFLLITVIANFMVLNLFTAILLEAFVDKLKPEKEKNSPIPRTPVEPSTTTQMLTTSVDDVSRKERISVSFNLTEKVIERKSPSRRSTVVECLAIDETIDKTSLIDNVENDELYKQRQSRISDDVIAIGSPAGTPGSATEVSSSTTEYRASTLSYPMTSSTASLLRTNQVAPVTTTTTTRGDDDVTKHHDDDIGKENGGTCHHHQGRQQHVTSSSVSSAAGLGKEHDDVISTGFRHNFSRCCCCWEEKKQISGSPREGATTVTTGGHSPTSGGGGNLQETIVELEKISHAGSASTRDHDMMSSVRFSDVISQTSSHASGSDPPSCFPLWLVKRQPKLVVNCDYVVCDVWLKTRKACYEVTQQNYFEGFILLLILASTICLAMEDINLKNDPYKKNILEKLEYVFAILFTIELVLKITGFGLIKYFTSLWCWLDFGIVVASWVGIIIQSRGEASSFRVLRTVRALRPLRAVSRWEGMKAVVNALFSCIPSIANVLCVCLLIWLVFGIMGVQFFKGKFFRCVDKEDNIVKDKRVVDKKTCLQHGYGWFNPTIHFDNVGMAVLALLQVATFEGWMEIIASASDITEIDKQPIRDHGKYNAVFFVFFVLIGSFFILNLIVGVIIESFQKLRKKTDASSAIETLMTDTQKNFYKTMRTMLNRKPKKTIPKPKAKWQLFIFNMVTHSRFELGVFFLILINIVTLSMGHYHQTPEWSRALRFIDIIFTSVFATEAILKIVGTRHHYFRDAFNVFDLIVILVSITGFILEEILPLTVSPTLLRVVRVFRVFRVLRVVRAARGIRRLILTLFISLPALFNIAILLSVFIIIYAILGMNLFMEANNDGAINDIVNFRTFANSVMLLFRLITSAGWNDILDPLTNPRNCHDKQECVDGRVAIAYFVSFIWIVFLVIVNMYIAIILENFDEILQQDKSGVSQGEFDTFYIVWGRYDPQATQFVSLDELSNLIHELHPPFQLPKPNQVKIAALELPVYKGDKVHCLDVLYALVKRKFGDVEIPEIMKKEAEMRLLKSFPNRRTLKPETTTLILRQHTRAARIIQNWYRSSIDRKLAALEKKKNQPLNGADEQQLMRGKLSTSSSSSSYHLPSPPSDAGSLQLREPRPTCRVLMTSRGSAGATASSKRRLKIAQREDSGSSRSYNSLQEEDTSSSAAAVTSASGTADQHKMALSKSSVDFTGYEKSHFVATTTPGSSEHVT